MIDIPLEDQSVSSHLIGHSGERKKGKERREEGGARQQRERERKAGQGRAGQGRAGQGKAGQGRAGQGRAEIVSPKAWAISRQAMAGLDHVHQGCKLQTLLHRCFTERPLSPFPSRWSQNLLVVRSATKHNRIWSGYPTLFCVTDYATHDWWVGCAKYGIGDNRGKSGA